MLANNFMYVTAEESSPMASGNAQKLISMQILCNEWWSDFGYVQVYGFCQQHIHMHSFSGEIYLLLLCRMCVVLRMENKVKGWCAGDEPCSSSTKKQTAQTLQVYESNHSDKQSSRLNMWSHPDAVASSVHQQQEMQWAKERPIVKKICHLFFFSWYIISEDHFDSQL